MRMTLSSLAMLAATAALSLGASASAAPAPATKWSVLKPLFVTIPHNAPGHHKLIKHPTSTLTQWNGSFTDHLNQTINYTMVGTDPATTNTQTAVPVVIIPIKMVYGKLNGNRNFNPSAITVSNGKTVTQNFLASPLFKNSVDFVQGGTDVGKTQYIDAFQRANFWKYVQNHKQYHVRLGTVTLLKPQTITVSPAVGQVEQNPFGSGQIGTMEIDVFDLKLQDIMAANPDTITPGVLPLFISANIYLTEGTGHEVCCIGGYHSALASQPGGQTYAYATYDTEPGVFSQDVSAWSHEIGEWMDDPFVDNSVNCADNSSMEDGDPLENNANYGAFPYTVNGFTYNLQSLVFIGYFGAPTDTSLHSWLSFQNDMQNVCPGQ
jgi:hypothetical protein